MIMLASRILDTRPDARHLDALDITVRRNAFGRQTDSFEADLEFTGITDLPEAAPLRGVFIRAPWVEQVGPEVSVLARARGGDSRWACRRADRGRGTGRGRSHVVPPGGHRRSARAPVLRRPGAALIRRGTAGG